MLLTWELLLLLRPFSFNLQTNRQSEKFIWQVWLLLVCLMRWLGLIFQHSALITTFAIDNSERVSEIKKTFTCQSLCENVSKLQHNFTFVNQFSNKMIFSINMLGPLVKDIILWQCNCRSVFTENCCHSLLVMVKIPEHSSHPNWLTHCCCCDDIFNFYCW